MNNFHCNTHANTFKQQLCVCDSEKQCNGGLIFKNIITERHGPAHQRICHAKPEDLSSIPRTHYREIPQSCPDIRRHAMRLHTQTHIMCTNTHTNNNEPIIVFHYMNKKC